MVQRTGLPCAIMFVDVCGTAERVHAVGNARAQADIALLLATLSDAVDRHSGRTIKTIVSQAMCVFPAAHQAAAAAVDAQQAAKAAINKLNAGSLAVRVGLHYGPVIEQKDDVFGDAVNVAARVLSHAKPGQILLTGDTARELPKEAGVDVRSIGDTHVKGKAEPVDLVEFIWERESLTMANARLETKSEDARLIARFGNTAIELSATKPALQMGRSDANDFVVSDPQVSRVHARIEYRRNRFFLVDQSSNGTFLSIRGKGEVMLRRDEIALESSGLISLGTATAEAPHLCLQFTVHKRS
jgi:adenylate cyclase